MIVFCVGPSPGPEDGADVSPLARGEVRRSSCYTCTGEERAKDCAIPSHRLGSLLTTKIPSVAFTDVLPSARQCAVS